MREWDGTTANYLEYGTALVVAPPLTLSAFFEIDTTAGAQGIFCVGGEFAPWAHALSLVVVGNALWAITANAGGSNQAVSTAVLATGTLYHGCGIFSATPDRDVYVNGGDHDNDSGARVPVEAYMERTRLGIRESDPLIQTLNGRIGEPAAWDIDLTAEEALMLSLGVSPLLIRPENLIFYMPCIDGNNVDIVGGISMTEVGSVTVADHLPPMMYPGTVQTPITGSGSAAILPGPPIQVI